jgi:hypothetical protein
LESCSCLALPLCLRIKERAVHLKTHRFFISVHALSRQRCFCSAELALGFLGCIRLLE